MLLDYSSNDPPPHITSSTNKLPRLQVVSTSIPHASQTIFCILVLGWAWLGSIIWAFIENVSVGSGNRSICHHANDCRAQPLSPSARLFVFAVSYPLSPPTEIAGPVPSLRKQSNNLYAIYSLPSNPSKREAAENGDAVPASLPLASLVNKFGKFYWYF
jgi:hypothetical protein